MHTRALLAMGSSACPPLLSAQVCCSDSDMPASQGLSAGHRSSCHTIKDIFGSMQYSMLQLEVHGMQGARGSTGPDHGRHGRRAAGP